MEVFKVLSHFQPAIGWSPPMPIDVKFSHAFHWLWFEVCLNCPFGKIDVAMTTINKIAGSKEEV